MLVGARASGRPPPLRLKISGRDRIRVFPESPHPGAGIKAPKGFLPITPSIFFVMRCTRNKVHGIVEVYDLLKLFNIFDKIKTS